MAIVPMKHIEIIALQQDAKKVVELLQRAGVVDLTEPGDEPGSDSELVIVPTSSIIAQLEKNLDMVRSSISAVEEYSYIKKSMMAGLSGRKELTLDEFAAKVDEVEKHLRISYDIDEWVQTIEKESASILYATNQIDRILPWEDLDIPMMYEGTHKTVFLIGSIQGFHTEQSLREALLKAYETILTLTDPADPIPPFPDYEVEFVSASREMSCLCVICHQDDRTIVEETLRKIGFTVPSDPTRHPPANRIARMRKRIKQSEEAVRDAKEKIAAHKTDLTSLKFLSDYLLMRRDKYVALGRLFFSQKTVVLDGFLPAEDSDRLVARLEQKYTLSVEVRDPLENEEVPGKFKNNFLVSPVEDIVQSYSPPTRRDIDPNPVMSFFYYLFFGMMLSDAGYGLILVLGTLFVILRLKPEGATRMNMFKFMYCGASSILWGLMFGSFFGNVVNAVGTSFFNQDVSLDALWFNPVEKPLEILILSLILGFIHLMAGLVLKFVNMWKHGDKFGAIFDVGSWWVVFAGLGMLIINSAVPTGIPFEKIGPWVILSGGLALLFTQGRSSPSIPGKIIGGLGSLYGITGYFSDTLSYSRLMALGLVTGIVGQVFNTIGTVIGTGIVRVLIFIPVFLFGHAVNLGISALGAYVHTNRLQYVEFFSKFYEGGGKAFAPFSVRTKHYRFKEEK
ncbi:MAG: V-type ATP synthase subunit I [Clostridiales bacterium]|nr:V-type ATP synthase subunit I [Clostridiales bacterium]